MCVGSPTNNCVERAGAKRGGCNAHGRRGLVEALRGGDHRAMEALLLYKQIFHIDAESKRASESIEQRFARRQRDSAPLVAELKAWLDARLGDSEPKSDLGKAVGARPQDVAFLRARRECEACRRRAHHHHEVQEARSRPATLHSRHAEAHLGRGEGPKRPASRELQARRRARPHPSCEHGRGVERNEHQARVRVRQTVHALVFPVAQVGPAWPSAPRTPMISGGVTSLGSPQRSTARSGMQRCLPGPPRGPRSRTARRQFGNSLSARAFRRGKPPAPATEMPPAPASICTSFSRVFPQATRAAQATRPQAHRRSQLLTANAFSCNLGFRQALRSFS